jgi:hypothetical protein
MSRRVRLAVTLLLVLIVAAVGISQVGWLLYTGGPYRGQIVDAETRQPIGGAVVFFQWDRRTYGSPGGPVTKFLRAREVLTDAQGRFSVSWFVGVSLNPFSVVNRQPVLTILYPGYRPQGARVTPPDGRPFKDPTVVPLRKLQTRKQRIDYIGGLPPGGVPNAMMPNLIRLMNNERTALGLKPVHVSSGARQ